MPPELSCTKLHAGYGRRDVLQGVSCRLSASRLCCILGPNGAGKTTLLRAIAGLLPLHAGSVQYDMLELTRLRPRERAKYIALVPQLAAEAIPLTVREAVALARYAHRGGAQVEAAAGEATVSAALQSLALEPLAHKPCYAISGGEWRRVLIAQGLAQESKVLLLDEPTAFLDPPARLDILAKLAELAHANGLIVAVVLHDPELALRYGDDAVLLRGGAVLAAGPVAEVVTDGMLERLYAPAQDVATEVN